MPESILTPKQVADWLCISAAWVLDHATRRVRADVCEARQGRAVPARRR